MSSMSLICQDRVIVSDVSSGWILRTSTCEKLLESMRTASHTALSVSTIDERATCMAVGEEPGRAMCRPRDACHPLAVCDYVGWG